MKPMPAKPKIIIAHVDGSGTAELTLKLTASMPQWSKLKFEMVMLLNALVSVKPKYWVPPEVFSAGESNSDVPSLKTIVTGPKFCNPVMKVPNEWVGLVKLNVTEPPGNPSHLLAPSTLKPNVLPIVIFLLPDLPH